MVAFRHDHANLLPQEPLDHADQEREPVPEPLRYAELAELLGHPEPTSLHLFYRVQTEVRNIANQVSVCLTYAAGC